MYSDYITVSQPIEVYYSQAGYPNEGIKLEVGEVARIVNRKVPAVFGPRPYFMLVEFERDGNTYRAAIWPGTEVNYV